MKKLEGKRKILFLGNTGSGKSCFCNSIMKWDAKKEDKMLFFSGASASRTTSEFQKCELDELIICDAPGLVDAEPGSFEKNKDEITKAITQDGNYTIIFVGVPFNGKRLWNADDFETVRIICSAFQPKNGQISFIINQMLPVHEALLKRDQKGFEGMFLDAAKVTEADFLYFPNLSDLDQEAVSDAVGGEQSRSFLSKNEYTTRLKPFLEKIAGKSAPVAEWKGLQEVSRAKVMDELSRLKKELEKAQTAAEARSTAAQIIGSVFGGLGQLAPVGGKVLEHALNQQAQKKQNDEYDRRFEKEKDEWNRRNGKKE